MQLKPIEINLDDYPTVMHRFLTDAKIFDSSCSPDAKVIFIDKDNGYFLKTAAIGSLEKEASLTRWFHSKTKVAEVIEYISTNNSDFMLTTKVQGEDCFYAEYLGSPKKLCDTLAEILAKLHKSDFAGCPIKDRTKNCIDTAKQNYALDNYDKSHFPDSFGYASAKEAYEVVEKFGHLLQTDTLIHGDYCLPNVLLDDWKFSGFIDLGSAGIGDRHIDLFWAMWSLSFNLKTDKYNKRFIDAYGKEKVDEQRLKIVAAIEVFG